MNKFATLSRGIIRENPIFVLLLGMCPTLGTTTSAINGLGMGLATMFVLILSNMVISLVAKYIPSKVRIPSFIVIIATFVTVVDFLMQAYVPSIHATLGLFIPLIVVNCIVLGRAEAFASKNSVGDALLDGVGMGLGFSLALTVLGSVRELFGSYAIFDVKISLIFASIQSLFSSSTALELLESGFLKTMNNADGIILFMLAPGAFLALSYLLVAFNLLTKKKA